MQFIDLKSQYKQIKAIMPVSLYGQCAEFDQINQAESVAEKVVSLPMHPLLSDNNMDIVVEQIKKTLQ